MAEKFSLIGNIIKKATFGGKGNYCIPVIIIKSVSGSEYFIQNLFVYKNLKKDENIIMLIIIY